MRISKRKIVDDALKIMSADPPAVARVKDVAVGADQRYHGRKRDVHQMLALLTKARWKGPDDLMNLRADLIDSGSHPEMMNIRIGESHMLKAIIIDWATDERDGEIEVLWFGRANRNAFPKRQTGNTK